jgi:hypothetical protein
MKNTRCDFSKNQTAYEGLDVAWMITHAHVQNVGARTSQKVTTWLIDWLWWVRLCLRTVATVNPSGDMRAWRAMVVIPAGDNSWLIHQSSLAVLPAEISGASRRNGRRSEDFAYQYLKYLKGSWTCRKILWYGTSGFTSHTKESVLRTFIALKNPPSRLGLNPRPLGPVASTLTTTPPRRQVTT